MSEQVLIGRGRELRALPRTEWEAALAGAPARIGRRLEFMSAEHHQVRNFVVAELPRAGRPLPPEEIARALGLSLERTIDILAELERRLFFLVRNGAGHVSWAFPVTVEATGHALVFSTGERLDAA